MSCKTRQKFDIKEYSCAKCSCNFSGIHQIQSHYYQSHVEYNSMPKKYVCNLCDSVFEDENSFEQHSNQHTVDTVNPSCRFCNETFLDESSLQSHVINVHPCALLEECKKCPVCDFIAQDGRSLYMSHIRNEHSTDEIFPMDRKRGECPACQDILSDEMGLVQHFSAKHADESSDTVYSCLACESQHEEDAEEHIKTKHDKHDLTEMSESCAIYSCPQCNSEKQTISQLESHYEAQHKIPQIACPECNATFDAEKRYLKHYWFNHSSNIDYDVEYLEEVPHGETLEYLYNINKHAKKYKRLASENYTKGKKTTAKSNSVKKEALYELKETVINLILDQAESIEIHRIDDSDFYFIDFDKYGFHCPKDTIGIPDTYVEQKKTLNEFHSGENKEKSDATLKQSLKFFKRNLDINANNFLTQKYLSYGRNNYFIGWKYLD